MDNEDYNYFEKSLADIWEFIDETKMSPVVKFKLLHPDAVIPEYKTRGAVGADIVAIEDIVVQPEAVVCVRTGFAMQLPDNYEAQVRTRSGMSIKGVVVANSPGTIDPDFTGEVMVIVRNHGKLFVIHKGDRIAQLVVTRVQQARFKEVYELDETARGRGGFGSTGIK